MLRKLAEKLVNLLIESDLGNGSEEDIEFSFDQEFVSESGQSLELVGDAEGIAYLELQDDGTPHEYGYSGDLQSVGNVSFELNSETDSKKFSYENWSAQQEKAKVDLGNDFLKIDSIINQAGASKAEDLASKRNENVRSPHRYE